MAIEVTIYRPGDAGFDDIAKQITHVSSIVDKEKLYRESRITEDRTPYTKGRRFEEPDKLR